jgi:hypothetical protein
MIGSWQRVVESLLRPTRPRLEQCLAEREALRPSRVAFAEERARAIRDCERRIEQERAAVFAANDGVISLAMTNLEREWRKLTRLDPDAGLMELWARIAPAAWIDRKRWRDTEPALRMDAAIALAADPNGVEAAETAIASLRAALAPRGIAIGPHVRWRAGAHDAEHNTALLGAVVDVQPEYAARFKREVHDAVLSRLPERPLLARDVAHAAFVESVSREHPSPVQHLRELWMTGYVISAVDEAGVTLELPL